MPTFDYVILTNSDNSVEKRFKAIKYARPTRRTDTFRLTLGGRWDKSAGVITDFLMYTFKCPASVEEGSLFATLDDLDYFYRLNSPAGSPNDLLTLVDHYGQVRSVKFRDDISPEPLTTQLEGPNAWHYVNVTFVVFGVAEGS